MRLDGTFRLGDDVALYALAYRPTHRPGQDQVDAWMEPLQVGNRLLQLPLGLRGAGLLLLDLEATSTETRQRFRL